MKANITKMHEAVSMLNYLQERLRCIEDRVQGVQRNLSRMQFGSAANTAAIENALIAQRKILEMRVRNMEQLLQVLDASAEQYRSCENQAKQAARYPIMRAFPTFDQRHKTIPLEPIARQVELETIERYIRPLMAGKKGTT